MSLITIESIEKALDKFEDLDNDALEKLSETYTLSQTELLGYLMQAANEYENDELESYIVYYFCIAMESMHQQGLHPNKITDEMIDAFHDDYMEVLEEYTREEDPTVLDTYINQPNFTAFLAEELDGEDEEGNVLDVETSSQLFIVLAAMIGLFNRALQQN
jgi:hypothetical protein